MPLENMANLEITMKINSNEDVPKTVGELRRRLAEQGNLWEVDPRLGDDDPLPDRPRGGQREEEVPDEHRLRTLEPGADLQKLIAMQPPANPFLKARWAEAGMLNKDEVESLPAESGEGEEGTG
jgi:hypothetical protein